MLVGNFPNKYIDTNISINMIKDEKMTKEYINKRDGTDFTKSESKPVELPMFVRKKQTMYKVEIVENLKGTGRWYHFSRDKYDYVYNEQKVPDSSPAIFVSDKIIGEHVQMEKQVLRNSAHFMNDKWVVTDPYYTSNPSEVIVTGLNTCFAIFVVHIKEMIALHLVTESEFQPQQLEKLKTVQLLMKDKNWTLENTKIIIIKTLFKHDKISTENQQKTISNINKYFGVLALIGEINKGTCTGKEALIFIPT